MALPGLFNFHGPVGNIYHFVIIRLLQCSKPVRRPAVWECDEHCRKRGFGGIGGVWRDPDIDARHTPRRFGIEVVPAGVKMHIPPFC